MTPQTCRDFLLQTGTWDDVDRLARQADDLDAMDDRGHTILRHLVFGAYNNYHPRSEKIIRNIIVRGADIDLWDNSGSRALDNCRQQWVSDLLVALGANVDPPGKDGLLAICMGKAGPAMADRRSIRFIVLATHKLAENIGRMVAEMVT